MNEKFDLEEFLQDDSRLPSQVPLHAEVVGEDSEEKLVNDIALLFFDAQTVKSIPSDYARAAIARVRAN